MPSRAVKCKIGEAFMGDDRIVCVSIYRDAHVTADDAQEIKKLMGQMDVDKPHAVLIDLTVMHSIDADARRILATPRNKTNFHTKAVAIVVKSAVSRVIANFFLGSARPQIPTKMFSNVDEARAFCLLQLQEKTSAPP